MYIRFELIASRLTGIKEDIEKKWLHALKSGDAEAFERVFGIYAKRLYYFALGYLKSKTEAEEVVQEVFYRIWKNREQINPDLSFKAYLFKIAYNYIQELFLKLSYEKKYLKEVVADSVSFSSETENQISYQSILEMVDNVVKQLPERQREIFIMRKKEGRSLKEIAAILDISPKTVENHITEAMKKIKNKLSGENLAGLLFFSLFIKVY